MAKLGAGVGGDPGFDESGYVDCGCAGCKEFAYALFFKEVYIDFGDYTAAG